MRKPPAVTVNRAIVHIVDHLKPQLFLSEAELDLTKSGPLQDYFTEQAKNGLSDQRTHSAAFEKQGSHAARDACFDILGDAKKFVSGSQELAKLLHAAMGNDKRIAPGSLAVCLVTAVNGKKTSDYLTLLKLDPGSGLIQKIDKDANGKRVVTFEVESDVMPPPEKLQKAALVPGDHKKPELLLLDQQTAGGPATFFTAGFLNAKLALDEKRATLDLYRVGIDTYEQLSAEPEPGAEPIAPEVIETVRDQFRAVLQTKTVNLEEFVENLPEEAKPIAEEAFLQKFPDDRRIKLDPVYAQEKLLKKSKFRGDGVYLEVDADREAELLHHERDEVREDGTKVSVLTLRVPNWRRAG